MTIQPSDDPAMSHAAGRDEAADGLGELEPSFAEGAKDIAGDDERPSISDVPSAAAGSGSGSTTGQDATGGDAAGGTATGSDLSHPLG